MDTILNHRYRLMAELGRGGQGVVYRAVDMLRGEQVVALKVMLGTRFSAMLRFEFEQAAELVHPHLAGAYDLGIVTHSDGRESPPLGASFFTQEYIEGVPSDRWSESLSKEKRIVEVVKIGVQVARALALIHRTGLVHRDIKPANILVNPANGVAKLIDFGLAAPANTADGLRAGTLRFMAPEALHGFPDARSDLFSLGVTLIALLSGGVPMWPSRPLAGLPFGTPAALQSVLARMIHPRVSLRFQNASDVVLALAKAVGASVLGDEHAGEVVDAATDSSDEASRRARSRSSELIGRDGLMVALSSWFGGKESGLQLGTMIGPPGVGKSRLFKAAVVTRQIECAAKAMPPPQLMSGTLRQLVRALLPDESGSPIVRQWLDGKTRRDRRPAVGLEMLIEEMVSLICDGAKQIDILHIEAEERELERGLLRRIAEVSSSVPGRRRVMIESRDPLPETNDFVHLHLDVPPLSIEDEQRLVITALGRAPCPESLETIHRLTGGVPALTETVLQSILSKSPGGALDKVSLDGLTLQGRPARFLTDVLATVSLSARRVVEAMAVAAEPLSENELSLLTEMPEIDLASALADLEHRGWISCSGEQVSMARLFGELVLETLPAERSAHLCKRMVQLLKQRAAPPWHLARYAVRAGLNEEAKQYCMAGAEILREIGDLAGAAGLVESFVTLLSPSDSAAGDHRALLAKLYRQTGRYREAVVHAEAAEKQGGASASTAALERANALRLLGKEDEALAVFTELSGAAAPPISVKATVSAARIALDNGRISEAATQIEGLSLDACRSAGVGTLKTVGLIALYAGDIEKAEGIFRIGLEDAASDARNQARFQGLLGMVHHGQSQWRAASTCYAEAFELARKTGDRHGAATYQVNLAAVLTEQGRLEEALNAYREGFSKLRLFGRPDETALAGANYAELLHRLGDLGAADEASAAALVDGRRAGHRALASCLCVRGDLLISRGSMEEAEGVLSEAEELSLNENLADERNVSRLHLAALAVARRRPREAAEVLARCSEDDVSSSPSLITERARLMLALALLGHGDVKTAHDALAALLPPPDAAAQAGHLSAFVYAARGALAVGDPRSAERAAAAVLDIQRRVREQTPSLYHQETSMISEEMRRILDGGSVGDASDGFSALWQRLARINTRLNSEMRIGRLLELVMDAALDITGAERGFLLIANPKGELKIRCARNIDKASLNPSDESFSRTVALRAYETAEPVLTTDAREDSRFNEMRSVVNLNLRYIVAVPLKVSGLSTGTIYLDSRHGGHFDDTRLALLEALSDQAAIALTNARLRTEIRRRQAKIERLNRALTERLQTSEGELARVRGELEKQTDTLITRYRYDEIIGRSKPMAALFRLLDRVVTGDFPVIVQGESGTGKELVARAIHFNSNRKRRAFVAENCAAIPSNLMESVLFGHVKGAFTGAVADNRGLFIEADKGTLFLDEIGEMSLGMQAKLLRVLQNGEVRPLGGNKVLTVDVRIVVAANTSLKDRVSNGEFREDLYYRLNVIDITLPPLRARKEDIPLLIAHFVKKHGDGSNQISKSVIEALMDFEWPGNVRQLENEVQRALVLSEGEATLDHLSEEVVSCTTHSVESVTDFDLSAQVERLKRRLVSAAMQKVGGNQTAAAELLGLSRYGLQKMLKRLEI